MSPRFRPFPRIYLAALALGLLAFAVAVIAPATPDAGRIAIAQMPVTTAPPPYVPPWEGNLRAAQSGLVVPTLGDDLWQPVAIFNDGADAALFTIRAAGGSFQSTHITTEGVLQGYSGLSPGLQQLSVELGSDLIRVYDDGTNGDRVGGDGIFSRAGITAVGALAHDGGTHQRIFRGL